jgi:hypothetical protein
MSDSQHKYIDFIVKYNYEFSEMRPEEEPMMMGLLKA